MKTFRQGTIIDIDDNDSKIDQISRDQASDGDISDLNESEKMVFREDDTFKERFLNKVELLQNETKGEYMIASDMTEAQHHARHKRI